MRQFIIAMLLFSVCFACLPPGEPAVKGSININIDYKDLENRISGQTEIVPYEDITPVEFSLKILDSAEQEVYSLEKTADPQSGIILLDPGEYTIIAYGYNSSGNLTTSGTREEIITDQDQKDITITLLPLEGSGSLNLTVIWNNFQMTSPVVVCLLTDPILQVTNFQAEISGNRATAGLSSLLSGYHELSVFVLDGGERVYSTAFSIRILPEDERIVTLTLSEAQSEVSVGLDININDPIEVNINGIVNEKYIEDSVTLEAQTVPVAPFGERIYKWYIDGMMVFSGHHNTYVLGPDLSPGDHRVDLIVKGLETAGSSGFDLVVSDSIGGAKILVDDYLQPNMPGRPWYYTRIGSDRGFMGAGTYAAEILDGAVRIDVTSGWGGVWTSLLHKNTLNHDLDPQKLLGPYIKEEYQSSLQGIEIHIKDGTGLFKVELKESTGDSVYSHTVTLPGGPFIIELPISPGRPIHNLNYIIDGPGFAEVDMVYLNTAGAFRSVMEYTFLFSYSHLSQCYDPSNNLTRDRASWPSEDFASVQTMGTFSLTTAIGADLGYIDPLTASTIVEDITNKILSLPRHTSNLLPHFIKNGDITPGTEWSSVDTIICLISQILASQYLGLDTTALENLNSSIDWASLTSNNTHPISMGYNYEGTELIPSQWEIFGSESFIAAVAFAAATGERSLLNREHPPTFDGSGFNDEMAALFFPMTGRDVWTNDWRVFRESSVAKQLNYFDNHLYDNYGWFGLSASEVPSPQEVAESDIYKAWGVGGMIPPHDGRELIGYPLIAPHYAAMIAAEYPGEAKRLFRFLTEKQNIFSALNNVESFGRDLSGQFKFNSLKGSWNLSLQALGTAKALSGDYGPYKWFSANEYISDGYKIIMPNP